MNDKEDLKQYIRVVSKQLSKIKGMNWYNGTTKYVLAKTWFKAYVSNGNVFLFLSGLESFVKEDLIELLERYVKTLKQVQAVGITESSQLSYFQAEGITRTNCMGLATEFEQFVFTEISAAMTNTLSKDLNVLDNKEYTIDCMYSLKYHIDKHIEQLLREILNGPKMTDREVD